MEDKKLVLYSPIQVDVIDRDSPGHSFPLQAAGPEHLDRVMHVLWSLQSQEDARHAFTASELDWSEICEKIISVSRVTARIDDRPYGVYLCRSKEELEPKEVDDLKRQCRELWEHGWGEGYAHCPREGSSLGLYIHFWQDDSAPLLTREQLEAVQKAERNRPAVTEVTPDTFWTLLAQAKDICGGDQKEAAYWLTERLLEMGPEQALNFDSIVHGYRDLSYKYGLWSAASIMCDGCTDDGFIDFRGWLIAQGREVYMSALKDPDSLADIPACDNYYFESLGYVGDLTYAKLTGCDSYHSFDRGAHQTLVDELGKDIVYGEGIDYPYTWSETSAYLPRLCAKYLKPGELEWRIKYHNDTWNTTSPEIQTARATAQKSKKIKKGRGDAR